MGQRKGLGIAGPGPDGQPRYVTAIDAESGTVRVGGASDLDVWSLTGVRPVFTSGVEPDGLRRLRGPGARARRGGGCQSPDVAEGRLQVALREPLRGVAPGQTMVLYRPDPSGDEVIGSATLVTTPR